MTSNTQLPNADAGRLDRGVGRLEPERASSCGLTECAGKPMCPMCTRHRARDDGMPGDPDERHLRRLLALRVGMPHAYYDDGEAQGQEHGISIDFMREPVAGIDAKLRALNVARLEVRPLPPYYIGGPYHDGGYAMCVTSTGRVVHREPPNARLSG